MHSHDTHAYHPKVNIYKSICLLPYIDSKLLQQEYKTNNVFNLQGKAYKFSGGIMIEVGIQGEARGMPAPIPLSFWLQTLQTLHLPSEL